MATSCQYCNSTNYENIGYDIYPDDKHGIIEEHQYICNECNKFFSELLSAKYGKIKRSMKGNNLS